MKSSTEGDPITDPTSWWTSHGSKWTPCMSSLQQGHPGQSGGWVHDDTPHCGRGDPFGGWLVFTQWYVRVCVHVSAHAPVCAVAVGREARPACLMLPRHSVHRTSRTSHIPLHSSCMCSAVWLPSPPSLPLSLSPIPPMQVRLPPPQEHAGDKAVLPVPVVC